MKRYTLWADETMLKTSDNLDEIIEVYKSYNTYDSPYADMFIIDNNTDYVIYG